MKLGILADIHEAVDNVQSALRLFANEHVEQVVLLGDVFETGDHILQTIDLLRSANAIGVWGNHDLGLCCDPDPEFGHIYGRDVLEFFASLLTRFDVDGCLFTHGLPTWDATDPTIYYLGDKPWDHGSLTPVFVANPDSVMFVGHFHRWYSAGIHGPVDWDGLAPLTLDAANPSLTVIHAVLDGWCAVFDTENRLLSPHYIGLS